MSYRFINWDTQLLIWGPLLAAVLMLALLGIHGGSAWTAWRRGERATYYPWVYPFLTAYAVIAAINFYIGFKLLATHLSRSILG